MHLLNFETKKSWVVVFVLVTLVFLARHIAGTIVTHGHYMPFASNPVIDWISYEETYQYAPRALKFFRTHQIFSEVDIKEFGTAKTGMPVFHAIFVGLVAKLTRNFDLAWIIGQTVFAVILFGLYFVLGRAYGLAAAPALLASTVAIFLSEPRNAFLLSYRSTILSPLLLTRFPHPVFSFSFVVALVLALFAFFRVPHRSLMWASGLLLGLGLSGYYYYLITLSLFMGILFLYGLVVRDRAWTLRIIEVSVIGVAVFSPTLYRMVGASMTNVQKPLMERFGTFTHHTSPSNFLFVFALAIFTAWRGWRYRQEKTSRALWEFLMISLIFSGALGKINQLISGYDAQNDMHFLLWLIKPVAFLFIVIKVIDFGQEYFRNRAFHFKTASGVLVLALIAVTGYRMALVGVGLAPYHDVTDEKIRLLYWMREKLPPDAVIGTSDGQLIALLPGITGAWTFVPKGDRTVATNREICIRYYLANELEGRSLDQALARLEGVPTVTLKNALEPVKVVFESPSDPAIAARCRPIASATATKAALQTRQLDYFILARDNPLPALTRWFPRSENIYATEHWTLYRLGKLQGAPDRAEKVWGAN